MKSEIIQKLLNQIYAFTYLQLSVTIATLPLLIYWGIPISLLSIMGNALFSPFLTLFLFLCTIIFFTNLIALQNTWIIYFTELVVRVWLYCMSFTSKKMLVYIPCPNIIIILIICIICALLLHQKIITTALKKCLLLICALICIVLLITISAPSKPIVSQLECHGGQVTIISANNKLCIIDPGVIGKTVSAPDWIEYTLLPYLTKHYATATVDTFIALQPSYSTFSALEKAVQLMMIKTIYIPYWQGSSSKGMLRQWFLLKEGAACNNCIIKRLPSKTTYLNYQSCIIKISQLTYIIEPKPDFTYHAFEVSVKDGTSITRIVSNKYKIKASDTYNVPLAK